MRILSIIALLISNYCFSQIHEGQIVFERKTNILKTLGTAIEDNWKGKVPTSKIDSFLLNFNDSISFFSSINSKAFDNLAWSTNLNTVVQHSKSDKSYAIIEVLKEKIKVNNISSDRKWKITDSERIICEFKCVKAFYVEPDGRKIYAWFCPYIVPSFGPEGFSGLPGLILGLATEDGSIIYFAKRFQDNFDSKAPNLKYDYRVENPILLKDKLNSKIINGSLNSKLFEDAIKWL